MMHSQALKGNSGGIRSRWDLCCSGIALAILTSTGCLRSGVCSGKDREFGINKLNLKILLIFVQLDYPLEFRNLCIWLWIKNCFLSKEKKGDHDSRHKRRQLFSFVRRPEGQLFRERSLKNNFKAIFWYFILFKLQKSIKGEESTQKQ